MYLYLGSNKSVRGSEVEAIFDLDTATVSTHTRAYLHNAQARGKLITLGLDLPKSFVLMRDGTVYLSPHNSSTIASSILG